MCGSLGKQIHCKFDPHCFQEFKTGLMLKLVLFDVWREGWQSSKQDCNEIDQSHSSNVTTRHITLPPNYSLSWLRVLICVSLQSRIVNYTRMQSMIGSEHSLSTAWLDLRKYHTRTWFWICGAIFDNTTYIHDKIVLTNIGIRNSWTRILCAPVCPMLSTCMQSLSTCLLRRTCCNRSLF